MAFTALTTAQIAVGEPTKKELFQKIKDNFDDHETRILSVEASATSTTPFTFHILNSGGVLDDAAFIRVPFDITLTGALLTVVKAGTAGTLEVDLLSDQGGSFSTVLSGGNLTRAFGDGDYSTDTAGALATTDIDSGKFLRLDVKAVQTEMRGAFATLTYTVR